MILKGTNLPKSHKNEASFVAPTGLFLSYMQIHLTLSQILTNSPGLGM